MADVPAISHERKEATRSKKDQPYWYVNLGGDNMETGINLEPTSFFRMEMYTTSPTNSKRPVKEHEI